VKIFVILTERNMNIDGEKQEFQRRNFFWKENHYNNYLRAFHCFRIQAPFLPFNVFIVKNK